VATAEVLNKGVPGADRLDRAEPLHAAHRPQSGCSTRAPGPRGPTCPTVPSPPAPNSADRIRRPGSSMAAFRLASLGLAVIRRMLSRWPPVGAG
jgi:hypothetical protein